MTTKAQELTEKIRAEFRPHFVTVENESHMHSSEKGANSHFKLVIVSDSFADLPKVLRHRQVYRLLAADLQDGIHALALHLYSLQEWYQANAIFPKSPNCMGGGKIS